MLINARDHNCRDSGSNDYEMIINLDKQEITLINNGNGINVANMILANKTTVPNP